MWFKSTRKQYKFITQEKLYAFYEEVSNQIESGHTDNGVWTKAFADSGGDTQKQKAIYIELMVERMALAEEALLEHKRTEAPIKQKKLRKTRENRGFNVPGALNEKNSDEVRSILGFIFILFLIASAILGLLTLIGVKL